LYLVNSILAKDPGQRSRTWVIPS